MVTKSQRSSGTTFQRIEEMHSADGGGADFIREKKGETVGGDVIGKVKDRKSDARNARKGAKVELV